MSAASSTTFPHFFPSITSFILFTLAASIIPASFSDEADHQAFVACKASFNCGALKNLKYPFLREGRPEYCGRPALKLNCSGLNEEHDYPSILKSAFTVLSINRTLQNLTITVADFSNFCPTEHLNGKDEVLFNLVPDDCKSLSMHPVCRAEDSTTDSSDCRLRDQPDSWSYLVKNCDMVARHTDEDGEEMESCPFTIDIPVNVTTAASGKPQSGFVFEYDRKDFLRCLDCENSGGSCGTKNTSHRIGFVCLRPGFDVKYHTEDAANCSVCEHTNGLCGTTNLSSSDNQFVGFCPDEPHSLHCSVHGMGMALWVKTVLAVAVALFVGIIMIICICVYHRRKEKKYSNSWNHSSLLHGSSDRSIEAFIREYQALASKRYNYSEIRRMTNSFNYKLGQGGYGSFYKGMLPDGRLVAVKVLNSAKGNGEEFINEVASVSRTSHVNVVALLGFCFDGSKRALIYEFMPNGSLEKFIRNDNSLISDQQLGVELLYKIAIGIAQGLGYLHRGCSTRILHFDIKPHNILLDEDFIPKISDFGLAKLCPPKESIVSMADARGTIGYIAPEVFSRNFGGVSHKSDVYSYGMMTLEMVGGKRNSNAGMSHSSDVYFPHWVYKRLELGEDVAFHSCMTIKENEIVKRMVLVGLWCIQADPSLRPSMSKVLEMLEVTSETLFIPPKPFLFSDPRLSATNSFTTSDVESQL